MTVLYLEPPTNPIVVEEQTPIFKELVNELGYDPLDHDGNFYEEYTLASEYHHESVQALAKLVRDAYL